MQAALTGIILSEGTRLSADIVVDPSLISFFIPYGIDHPSSRYYQASD